MPEISFFVPGIPKPGGSKRVFYNKKTGKAIVTDASGQKGKDWRGDVKTFAWENKPSELITSAVFLALSFVMPRPKGHYGTGRNARVLKNTAPKDHTNAPDSTKLTRAVEDALTGIIWKDDAQVTSQYITKNYGETPGVRVEIRWEE